MSCAHPQGIGTSVCATTSAPLYHSTFAAAYVSYNSALTCVLACALAKLHSTM